MDKYIRDRDGFLCKVLFETPTFYHVERVKDGHTLPVPITSAVVVEPINSFPGDWAINDPR